LDGAAAHWKAAQAHDEVLLNWHVAGAPTTGVPLGPPGRHVELAEHHPQPASAAHGPHEEYVEQFVGATAHCVASHSQVDVLGDDEA